jgi:MFS transporter, FHS family, glucose/mannose:H+ symporter
VIGAPPEVPVSLPTETTAARRTLTGFFLSGLLMAFLGAILPAWGHHIRSQFAIVGNYFLIIAVGLWTGLRLSAHLLPAKGIAFVLVMASALAAAGFLTLAALPASASPHWRYFGLVTIGLAAGLLNSAVFSALTPAYDQDRASAVNVAGVLFGLGSLVTSLLVAGTFYIYNVSSILVLFALIPLLFIPRYWNAGLAASTAVARHRPLREVLSDFRSPGAVLFALLLFFQFGNEWTLAGWLPVYLTQRIGVSPEASLLLLSLFWFALLVGRVAAQAALRRFRHGRMLMSSVMAALLGCVILAFTNNVFGATTAVLLVGSGFAAIYPLVVERIAYRFPYYHPGFFNGIFSIAVTGGLLAPASIGYMAEKWGIGVLTGIPLLGTGMVVLLLLLIWLEAKLSALNATRPTA